VLHAAVARGERGNCEDGTSKRLATREPYEPVNARVVDSIGTRPLYVALSHPVLQVFSLWTDGRSRQATDEAHADRIQAENAQRRQTRVSCGIFISPHLLMAMAQIAGRLLGESLEGRILPLCVILVLWALTELIVHPKHPRLSGSP
jgi:hypothetical protein